MIRIGFFNFPKRWRGSLQRHQPFLLLVLLFFVFRLLAILLLRPGGFLTDASDYDFYDTWGQLAPMGYRTFENLWTAYPPLFPALMLPIHELASRIPPWVEPRLFFHLLFGLELLLFECGNLVLLYRLAMKLDRGDSGESSPLHPFTPSPCLPPLLYALLFAPLYTLLGWFEAMPVFFLLLGLDLLLSNSRLGWVASAVAAALGFLTKLTPAVLAPIAVRWLGARLTWQAARHEWLNRRASGNLLRPLLYLLIFGGVVVGLGYWLVGGNLALAFSSFRINSIRPPWQSLWAILDGYYGYGLVPVDMRNLIGLEQSHWESRLPWGLISAGFALVYLWLYTRPYDWRQPRTPVAFSGVSLIVLFLYSKGWSPQFLVWILVFMVLLLPTARGIALAIGLSLVNVVESNIFLLLLPQERWLLVGTVVVRSILLLLLLVEFLGQIWPSPLRGGQLRQASARLTWAVLIFAVLGVGLAAPRAAQAYVARRLAEHPCREAIDFLRDQPAQPGQWLVSDQIALWRDLYPWLRGQYTIRIVDGYNPQDRPQPTVIAERLEALVGGDEFWWISRPQPPSQVGAYFARAEVHRLEEQQLGDCTLTRVIRLPETSMGVAAALGSPITLRQAALAPAQVGKELHLVLYWQAAGVIGESYTVFTQLFDAAGQMVAQQDNLPVQGLAPTNTWQPDAIIRDTYRLALPVNISPGDYRLLIGFYHDASRLMWTLTDGTQQDHLTLDVRVVGQE